MKKQWKNIGRKAVCVIMAIAMVLTLGVVGTPDTVKADTLAGSATVINDNYPWGKDMSGDGVTLEAPVIGGTSYQWQVSDEQNGTFENLSSDVIATTGSAITFGTELSAEDGKWYRCETDGNASEAVQLLHCTNNRMNEITVLNNYTYGSNWYISNGEMAYTVVSSNGTYTNFDVMGKYQKDGTDYWMNSAFSDGWQLFTSTEERPEATSGCPYLQVGNAKLKALRVHFDQNNKSNVYVEADLADTEKSFAFGSDVMLGTSVVTRDRFNPDQAALGYSNEKGREWIRMIGAPEPYEDTDPALVLEYTTSPSCFWLGNFSGRMIWESNAQYPTEVRGLDSGMTTSYMNLESGSTVKFVFGVGTVADTGALEVKSSVDYENEALTDLDAGKVYQIKVDDEVYKVKASDNGTVALVGTDLEGKSYDFTGKTLEITLINEETGKAESDPATVEVTKRPQAPEKQDEKVIEVAKDAISIPAKEGEEYSIDGGKTWKKADFTGYVVFENLTDTVTLLVRKAATDTEPASEPSESAIIQVNGSGALKTKYAVTGNVKNNTGSGNFANVKVALKQGNETIEETTCDENGSFTFKKYVPAGVYNIVITDENGKVVTQMVTVSDQDVTLNDIALPVNGVESAVKVKGTDNEVSKNSPIKVEKIVVGQLDKLAEEQKISEKYSNAIAFKVEMQVEAKKADADAQTKEAAAAIEQKTAGSKLDYVDMQLVPYVNNIQQERIADANMVLPIVLPYDLTNKENVKVVRYHENEAAVFTEYETMPAQGTAEDAHFYIDRENSLIYIYARYFSTYAIAYTTAGNGNGSNGNSSSGNTVIPAKTNQEILALAKTSAQQTLNQQKVTNATTKEEIAQAVEKALAAENGTKNVSAEVLSFTKVASTTEKEGSISGTIKLTINGVTEEVPFSYTIAKLPKESSAENSEKRTFSYMIATASSAKVGNRQVGMSWKKVEGADGYEVYASTCDGKNNFKRVADTKKLSYTHKKLSNSKAYKYYIRAYKLVNGKKVYLKKTVTIHVALKEQKYTNAKAVTLSKKSYELKAGQKVQIKAKTVKENAKKKLLTHTAEFRYYTDNSEIAVVSKNGKITAKKAGTCTIYVMANNGVYNTVKVTVK